MPVHLRALFCHICHRDGGPVCSRAVLAARFAVTVSRTGTSGKSITAPNKLLHGYGLNYSLEPERTSRVHTASRLQAACHTAMQCSSPAAEEPALLGGWVGLGLEAGSEVSHASEVPTCGRGSKCCSGSQSALQPKTSVHYLLLGAKVNSLLLPPVILYFISDGSKVSRKLKKSRNVLFTK